MSPTGKAPDDVTALSDMETSFFIAGRHGLSVVEQSDHGGPRRVFGSFAETDDAERLLVMMIGASWRSAEGLRELIAREVSPNALLDQGPTAHHLTWNGGSAEFPLGIVGKGRAFDFSRVVGAPLQTIAQSFEHPEGKPLFG